MFTGIIEAVGHIQSIRAKGGDSLFCIHTGQLDMSDVQLSDSIAVNGVCLTVIEQTETSFCADVSGETLTKTVMGKRQVGDRVNLEKALTPTTRLGGHLVSGHVDGVGYIRQRTKDARSERFVVECPAELAKYIAHKGSITVDGVSLTVNAIDGCLFDLNIVPHTIAETIIGDYQSGSPVHLEVDLIARYLERLLLGEKAAKSTSSAGISESFLAENGFIK